MKFEYRLRHMRLFGRRLELAQDELNNLAKDGWVLVQVSGLHGEIFVFQREITSSRARGRAQSSG